MGDRGEPKIVPNPDGKEYSCITFKPELRRFGMDHLDDDIVALMTKRVYDMAGCTPASVKVKLNGKVLDIKNFHAYSDMYLQTVEYRELPKIIEVKPSSDRWEVVCSLSDG